MRNDILNQVVYLVMFVLFSVAAFVVPVVYVRRYRYFAVRIRGTVYQRRFQVGWLLMIPGAVMLCIGCAIVMIWLLNWPPLGPDQWLLLAIVIFSLSFPCLLGGNYLVQDGYAFLRASSRRTSPEN